MGSGGTTNGVARTHCENGSSNNTLLKCDSDMRHELFCVVRPTKTDHVRSSPETVWQHPLTPPDTWGCLAKPGGPGKYPSRVQE